MMQGYLTSKYNMLLSFRYDEAIIQNLEGVLNFIKDLCTETAITFTSSPGF